MTKRIRRVSDLPNWYDIGKYQEAEKLGCLGWYWQLSARSALHNFVAWPVSDEVFDKFPNDAKAITAKEAAKTSKGLLEIVRNHPILDAKDPRLADKFVGEFLPVPGSGVRFASRDDFDKQSSSLRPEVLIKVNLDIPERLLLENFEAFVRKAKEANNSEDAEPPRYRKSDFKEWVRVGILPYLDLKIWEIQQSLSIPNRVMADAIFSGDEEGEEVVRKTTAKLADQVLNGNVLNVLAILHATEQMEGRP